MKRRFLCKEYAKWLCANRRATAEEKVAMYKQLETEVNQHNAIYETTAEGIAEREQAERERQEILAIQREREERHIARIQELAQNAEARQWIAPLVVAGLID